MTLPAFTVSRRWTPWIAGAPALALLLMVGAQLSAADLIYPADAGVTNVRTLGARGDGVTDDTAALQAAYNGTGLIYLPNGTYLVSGQILAPPRSGSAPARRVLVGQSRDGVVIRLKDACAGFTDPAAPRSILRVSYGVAQAFRNSVRNLTIDVGSGNPGAMALEFFASNQGAIDGVALRTADAQRRGHTGLLLTGDNGPLLVKDLTVTGFDIGIKANANATATFRRITLADQRTVGIDAPNRLFVHGLTSRNAVPALRTTAAISVLIDADLTGGAPSAAAIEVVSGVSFIRSVRTAGYQRALAATAAPDTPTIGEWTSASPVVVTGAWQTSLQLPLEDPPAIPWDDPSAWANAAADPDAAHGDAFQAALDSGAATVYFPRTRTTYLTGTFTIPATVRRIIGCEAEVKAPSGQPGAHLVIEGGDQPLVIEHIDATYGKFTIENRSARTLVLRSLPARDVILAPGSTGKLFIEDIANHMVTVNGQQVWAWQYNQESGVDVVTGEDRDTNPGVQTLPPGPLPQAGFTNNGGQVWIFGMKTEKNRTKVWSTAGGSCEVYAYILANWSSNVLPMFINEDSRTSIVVQESASRQGPYQQVLRDIRQGVITDLLHMAVATSETSGCRVPLATADATGGALNRRPSLGEPRAQPNVIVLP